MFDTNDSPIHSLRARPLLLMLALSLAAAWLTMGLTPERYTHPALRTVQVAPATTAQPPQEDTNWTPTQWWEVSHQPQARWIRFEVDRAALDLGAPALAISGTFSARVYVNGELQGDKGVPGLTADAETPGPIDAVIGLGNGNGEGRAEVLILTSAFHAGYQPAGLFHALGFRNFTDDPRRRASNYLLAMTQASLLLALAACFAWWSRRDRPSRWATAAAAAALLALGAECIRIWVNYPYPWQAPRQFIVWAGLTAAGLSLAAYVAARFRLPRRALAVGSAVIIIAYLAQSGADSRTASGIAGALLITLWLLLRVDRGQRTEAWPIAAVLLPWPAIALWNAPGFLDNAVYLFLSLTLSVFAVATLKRLHPAKQTPEAEPAPGPALSLEGDRVAVSEVVALQAAGNYVEVIRRDGGKRLYRASLGGAIDQAPSQLMRVHRSHAVNLQRARRLHSRTGSRYALELDDGTELPVGRSFVADVRRSLTLR